MNSALLAGRESWLTIRVEQRGEYFAALCSAQLQEDFGPFAHFIRKSATAALERGGWEGGYANEVEVTDYH